MTRLEPARAPLDHGDAEALLACQTRVLALMSEGAELTTMLDTITEGLEELLPGSRCSLSRSRASGASSSD